MVSTVAGKIAECMTLKFNIISAANEIPSDGTDWLLAIPPTSTWSRLRHARNGGPPPLRDIDWPWGFPWAVGRDRTKLDNENHHINLLLEVFKRARALSPHALLTLLHPEDLGNSTTGRPASLWQLPEIRKLATDLGLLRGALFQCNFGFSRHAFPMGLLTSHSLGSGRIKRGWPLFRGDAKETYIGPLPSQCECGTPHGANYTRSKGHESLLTPDFMMFLAGKGLSLTMTL